MTISITHSTPADSSFSASGAAAWDATHSFSGVLPIAYGGTNATDAATALTNLGAYPASNPSGYTNNTGTVTSVAALTLGTTGTDLSSSVATGTTTPVITLNVPTASATNRGVLSAADWSTFNSKQPAGSYLTAVTADAPLSGSGTSGSHLVIAQANTSTSGYLTSTDWNTFNSKGDGTVTSVAALTLGTSGTDLSSSVATGTTTPVITLNVPTASATNRGALSSTDWSTFNSKQAALVSGTNIKTINGSSILGSGDLTVSASAGGSDTQIQFNSTGALAGSASLTWDGTTLKGTNIEASAGLLADGTFSGTFVDGIVVDYVSGMGRISVGGADGIEFYNGGVATNLLGHVSSGGNWDFNGSVTAGTGTPIGGATNPLIVSAGAANGYIQNYLVNNTNGASSSSDIACYPHNGSDTSGFIDMGVTSQSFSDANYTVTAGNEGYIFMSAPSGSSTSGNLVIATDSTGTANDIQFYTGGFNVAKGSPTIVIKNSTGGLGIGVASPTAYLHIKAGIASEPPLKFTSGTVLTTAEAGAFEYDGKLQYFTPAGTARALTLNAYYYRKNTSTVLSSATGNQSIFGLTTGVTLQGSTIYEVEGEFELTTTGTTSHTEAFGFVLTTATVSGMGVAVNRLAATTTSSALGGYLAAVTPVVVTGALTTAQTVIYRVKGAIGISTAGSINPVIAFSAAPGGTSTVVAGAWFKFTPIGTTGSNVSIGTWA